MVQRKDSQQNQSYKLSILIAQDGLSFCILNKKQNSIENFHTESFSKILNPEKILEELKKAFKFHLLEETKQKITSVKVIYSNALYSIVPHTYFSEENLTDYLKFNIKILKTDFIAFDHIEAIEAKNVFIPYTNINNYLLDNFGEFNYKHASTLFIEQFSEIANQTEAYVYVEKNMLSLYIFKDKELLLANSFEYFTPQDFIYYILFCFEQLKLDTEKVRLKILGKINETDSTYNYLYTYIKEIEFLNTSLLTTNFTNLSQKQINPKQNFLLLSNLL